MLTGRVLQAAGMRAMHGSVPGTKPGANQDAALAAVLPDGIACAVADGVSSSEQAALAAQTAVRVTLDAYVRETGRAPAGEALRQAVVLAHHAVRAAVAGLEGRHEGATTLVAAALHGRRIWVANAGDSRAYVLNAAGELKQITVDHSWVQERMQAGTLDPREVATHPWRSVITRYLGGEEAPEVDVFEYELGLGEMVLLCSDGLMKALSEAEVATIVATASIEDAVEALLSLAEARRSYDDVTVCVVRLDPRAVTA